MKTKVLFFCSFTILKSAIMSYLLYINWSISWVIGWTKGQKTDLVRLGVTISVILSASVCMCVCNWFISRLS